MMILRHGGWKSALALALLLVLAAGCATPKIDWNSRIGMYSYDQAVMEFGPPDKYAKLTDGSLVVEWLTRRGYTYTYSPLGYGYWYGPFYPGPGYYVDTFNSPDCFLRLTFDPAGHLKAWKRFYR